MRTDRMEANHVLLLSQIADDMPTEAMRNPGDITYGEVLTEWFQPDPYEGLISVLMAHGSVESRGQAETIVGLVRQFTEAFPLVWSALRNSADAPYDVVMALRLPFRVDFQDE